MKSEILSKVVVGVITAVILTCLAIIWNAATSGGLVSALGGVTKEELQGYLTDQNLTVPSGMIVMTNHECASLGSNWSKFNDAGGRFPIASGATIDINGDKKQFVVGHKDNLGEYQSNLTGLPAHKHTLNAIRRGDIKQEGYEIGGHFPSTIISLDTKFPNDRLDGRTPTIETLIEGQNIVKVNNIPPYITLNFCINS